jgi:hypothetical protein
MKSPNIYKLTETEKLFFAWADDVGGFTRLVVTELLITIQEQREEAAKRSNEREV